MTYQQMVSQAAATIAGTMAAGVPDRDLAAVARRALTLAKLIVDGAMSMDGPA